MYLSPWFHVFHLLVLTNGQNWSLNLQNKQTPNVEEWDVFVVEWNDSGRVEHIYLYPN